MSDSKSANMTLGEALDHYSKNASRFGARVATGGRSSRKRKKGNSGPDLEGFEKWLAVREVERLSFGIAPHNDESWATAEKASRFWYEIIEEADAGGFRITREGVVEEEGEAADRKMTPKKLRLRNRKELLRIFLTKWLCPRTLDTLVTLKEDGQGDPGRGGTVVEHHRAIFEAISAGDEHQAYMMAGRLQDEGHPSGEIEYFYALVAYHAGHYKKCIDHVRTVDPTGIDYPRAYMLLLESLAWLGDHAGLIEAASVEHFDNIPDTYPHYLAQIAILNGDFPPEELEPFAERLRAKWIKNGTSAINMDDPFARKWVRFSSMLVVEYVKRITADYETEKIRIGSKPEDSSDDDLSGSREKGPFVGLTPRTVRLFQALHWDAWWLEEFREGRLKTADKISRYLCKRVMAGGNEPHDFVAHLKIQYELQQRKDFVENVAGSPNKGDNLKALISITGKVPSLENEIWSLVSLAYEESIILRLSKEEQALRSALLKGPLAEVLDTAEEEAGRKALEDKLSPMGRIAYRTARWDLEKMVESGNEWLDAGMCSLGFFRILELEYNEWLIRPLLRTALLEELGAVCEALSGESNRKQKNKKYWSDFIRSLKNFDKTGKGLELGALEIFLGKIRKEPDREKGCNLTLALRDTFAESLNHEGIEALGNYELIEPLDAKWREKFRNPPAHTRYLTVDIALECRQHVETALGKLHNYLR